jgi:hypothetical protein
VTIRDMRSHVKKMLDNARRVATLNASSRRCAR